ncbi:MAG TPA: DNA polymerase III subunit beta [Candidatus Binatia bacterium]
MEFSIDRSEFLQGLSPTQGVVERRNTLPILANVLLEAKNGLTIAATDLEVHIRRRCNAKVKTAGAATVGARKLLELVRELKPGEITVRALENQFIEVVSGRSRVKLVGLPAADFPAFPQSDAKAKPTFSIPSETLAQMIDRTLFAVSTDETRPHLGGVYMTANDATLRFVGTDGHRLALVDQPVKDVKPLEKGIILPRKGLAELRRLLDDGDGVVSATVTANGLRVQQGDVELVMRLVDGEFPNYEQVIPKTMRSKIVVDKTELLSALRRVSVVASDRARGVKLHIGEGQLTISASSPDFGEASEEIEVAYSGEPLSVGFNSRYLTDVLAVLPDEQRVELALIDDASPGIVRSEEDDSYSYVVMPMRL